MGDPCPDGHTPAMSASPSASAERTFICTEAGCDKSFLRSEHLSRHRLNHRPSKIYSCPRCPKEFVRPDLYQRHKARHDKGMWYRQVGGVVEKSARRRHQKSQSPNRTSGESSTALVTQVSYPEDSIPQTFDTEPVQNGRSGSVEVQYESTVGDGSATRTQQAAEDSIGNQSLSYHIPNGGADTLFFDDSANIQDLPEDLDWFFEAGQRDWFFEASQRDWFFEPSQPGLSSNMDLAGAIQPAPAFHEVIALPTSVPYSHQSTSPSTPPYDSTWSIARSRILASLSSLRPEILDSPFFIPSNLAMLYDLYFKNYHHHFPILHQPSLSITDAHPLLLTAILTLGATLATDPVFHYIGQQIHDALQWIILATGKFEPPSPLWCLQALLLVQALGKMFSTTKHHEMAHIFHGAILTMMKRGRAYSTISSFRNTQSTSLEIAWRQWAEDESSRRTAFFAFLMDAQHASVFGHTPVLSVSDMRLPLPCSDALWSCSTAAKWEALTPHTPKPPQFLPTLKALLGKTLVPSVCSDFSRFIILHGLLSLTTHLHARGNTTLGLGIRKLSPRETPTPSASQVEDWRDTMSTAIETWSFCLLSLEPSLCLEAAQPLHRMAYITLHTNITDFHILAKDMSGLDNVLLRNEFSKAKVRIREWSGREEACEAVMHTLLLVKETVFIGRRYRASEDNIVLRPWCLYQAILVLWAYGVMVGGPSDEGMVLLGADEYVVSMLSALPRGKGEITGANRTRGLISAIADALEGSRWELLQEAHVTLLRLSGRNNS